MSTTFWNSQVISPGYGTPSDSCRNPSMRNMQLVFDIGGTGRLRA